MVEAAAISAQSVRFSPGNEYAPTASVRKLGWDYRTFADNGIFVELGEGCVDFGAILEMLRGTGFEGWLIVETDVTRKPSAFDSARISREFLRRMGL